MVAVAQVEDPERLHQERHAKALHSMIAELAAALADGVAIDDMLTKLTSASLELVSGADCAKISLMDNGQLRSIAATSQLISSLDDAQQAARHGPCLEAISARNAIRCDDLGTDVRWPRFASHATTAGLHSVLSTPIDIPGDTGATFSLFGFRAGAFGAESETLGAMLAKHASIALVKQRQEREFKAALATRDVIGQAKGMIMERFGVDATQAFAMLAAISQDTNTPVRDLAARFVDAVSSDNSCETRCGGR
jgi:transcriptional regulator with GAF, ATPase, and Fis domain